MFNVLIVSIIVIAVALLWHAYPNSSHYQHYSSKIYIKKAPGLYRYEEYQHPTEEQHRTAEQYNWQSQNRLTLFAVVFAAIAAGFAIMTYIQTKRQADAAESGNAPALFTTSIETNIIPPDRLNFFAQWKNGGRSFASFARVGIFCGGKDYDKFPREERGTEGTIGPDQTARTNMCPGEFSISLRDIVNGKTPNFIIFTYACYREVGKKEWRLTESNWRVLGVTISRITGILPIAKVERAEYNCVDEDCEDYPRICETTP